MDTPPPPLHTHYYFYVFFAVVLLAGVSANALEYHTFHLTPTSRNLDRLAASESGEADTWEVEIEHRDRVNSGLESAGITARLARDAARVEALEKKLAAALAATPVQQQSLQDELAAGGGRTYSSPVVSGLSQGSGEYFTRLGLGTPPKFSSFVLDTGSDISWTQCQPCPSARCYKQTDPLFNPAGSSTYRNVGCTSPICAALPIKACLSGKACLYQVQYGDGSFTVGNMAQESITFNSGARIPNVAIGCGHNDQGLFTGASGLLGLGGGSLSLPSQLRLPFSYCLADRFTGSTSSLMFGPGAAPASSVFAPLLKNPKLDTFFYVPLQSISVGGNTLRISPSLFAIQTSGNGGVILDSGTSITRLITPAYTALRDAFRAGSARLPSAAGVSLFDTCYALGSMTSVDVPTVQLHFAGGATMSLPPENYLIPVDTSGTYCFGFAGTSAGFSILGNMQQQTYRISFNTGAGRVGFAANQC